MVGRPVKLRRRVAMVELGDEACCLISTASLLLTILISTHQDCFGCQGFITTARYPPTPPEMFPKEKIIEYLWIISNYEPLTLVQTKSSVTFMLSC